MRITHTHGQKKRIEEEEEEKEKGSFGMLLIDIYNTRTNHTNMGLIHPKEKLIIYKFQLSKTHISLKPGWPKPFQSIGIEIDNMIS